LLTNTAPLDARDRFLHPDELVQPRQINPDITPRSERAILWAMSLHPDERPESVERFRLSLLGDTPVVPRPASSSRPLTLRDVFRSPQERVLMGAVIALTLFSLFFTLMR
jgi:serine/threonine-protein kinase